MGWRTGLGAPKGGVAMRIIRGERKYWLVAALVLAGAVERIAFAASRATSGATGEAMRVASAVGAGRGFADAYRLGQGPTAHLLPTMPLLAGGIYRLLGIGSPVAEAILAVWAVGLAMATYLLLYRASAGSGHRAGPASPGSHLAASLPLILPRKASTFAYGRGVLRPAWRHSSSTSYSRSGRPRRRVGHSAVSGLSGGRCSASIRRWDSQASPRSHFFACSIWHGKIFGCPP